MLSLILIVLIVVGFIGFINITPVFGQLSITLKWRANGGTGSTWMGPLAADLNNDGLMEIVINGLNGIAALDPTNGSVIWSKPYTAGHGPCEIIDLNKDSIPEILFVPDLVNGTAGGGVLALHGNNGSVYWYNRKAAGDDTFIAVADINADGYPEIYSVRPGLVTALTYDGRIFASTYTYYSCWGGLTIGDTDFDGVFEVYLGERSESYPSYPSGGRGLRAFWADNLTEIWAYPDILCSSQAPVLADVDKDGDLEIIILNQSPAGIAVINTDGSVNTYGGIYRKQSISGLKTHSNPPVADLDGDGNLELITCGDSSKTYTPPKIWDLVDWKLDATLPFGCNQPPGVADITGDGKLEIIAPNQQNVTIFKYNPATTNYDIIYTIPIASAHPFSIAQDIDADGKLELVFNQHNSWVSVYDVETHAPTPLPRSGRYFYSEYRTRLPVYVPPPDQPPKISEISPSDGATNVSITLSELSFKLTDFQNDLMNYTVTTNPDIGSVSGTNVPNGKITIPVSGLAYSTTYAWTVTATDGAHTTTRNLTFITELAPNADDIIFDSNFDMGNLINVTYQDGAPGYRYYKAAVNYTIGTDPAHTGYSARTNNDKHWWFYFSMENVAGKTVAVSIVNGTDADWSTSTTAGNRWPQIEPVYSYDNINWYRVPLSGVTYDRTAKIFTINITIPVGYNKVWLAPLPPYNIARRDALFAEFESSPYLTVTSLGTTPGGQELKVATITDPAYADSGKFRSYVIAQQHSGETPPSWNAEGLIRFLLSDDPTAAAIRRSYIFRIIPIVNVDGVYQGICRYTPVRNGYQYDLNRWWNVPTSTSAPFEVRTIYNDIQAFNPHSFNDMHSTINTEQNSEKEALTYRYSTLTTEYTNFMDRIRDGGWPETWRAASTLTGGAFQNIRSRLGVTFSLSWENPHDELRTNPGVKLTVNDWMTWGQGWAKGNYLYFGDATATLTVTTSGSGSVVKDPDYATYTYGTSVELTATADVGYTFSHWEGDLTGNLNPATIIMTGNKNVHAVFVEGEYTLTINVEGSGAVSRDNNGPYHYGDVVQLTAIPDLGWEFASWSGDLIGTENPANIIITQNMVVTAHFTGQQYTIVASVNGIGGTVDPSGSIIVTHGQDQTFIITPDAGYYVSDVIIDGSSIGPTTSYTFYSVDNNHTITAVFAQNEYVLTIHVIGDGSIAKSPDKTLYTHGEIVELTATANSGWEFSDWSGDLIGADNPATIIITSNMDITAHFTLKQYVINASVSGTGGTIEPSGLVTVLHGEDETFTITPDIGYHVLDVLVDGKSQGAITTYTFSTVDTNHTITAIFTPNEYTLTVNVSPEGSGAVTLNNMGPYYYGDVVQLTAIAEANWTFSYWSGDVSGTSKTTTITIDGNKSVTAVFIETPNWWNTSWNYRRTITIDHTKVVGELTDFPVLIEITDSGLAGKAQSDGDDFVFIDASNNKLDHQIELYDNSTGRLIVWVKVPLLSSTADTLLYMYYGNPTCENQQNSTAVWDANYKLVLHLNENIGTLYDSTINGNNGTSFGSLVQGVAGAIGNCVEFNGGYIELPRVCTSEVQFTFSAWIYARSGARYFISEWWGVRGAFLQVYADSRVEFYVNDIRVFSPITLNQWYYVVGTFDGATAWLYINGGSPASTPASNPIWPAQNMYIGDRSDHNRKFNGFIDEVRVSNVARSATWILTEYNNQFNPEAFCTIGPEEQYIGSVSAGAGEYMGSFNNSLQTENTKNSENQQETNIAYLIPLTLLAAVPVSFKPRKNKKTKKQVTS